MKHVAVLLHNIRSAHNVGAIFRTADGAGASKVFLTGYTPAPFDRFKRPQKEIAKTALGADAYVAWEHAKDASVIIARLKKQGYLIVGVEQDKRSIDYRGLSANKDVLFIFGNEVRGLSPQLKKECDVLVEIPMRGRKESLNVATTVGVILFSNIS